MSVTLVCMPYAALERPSIALGLLKSGLEQSGIPTRVVYANWKWAEALSLTYYRAIEGTPAANLLGEWTFSQAAFGQPGSDAYLERALEGYQGVEREFVVESLARAREQAEEFLEQLVQEVLQDQPRLVGCSSTFQQNCASLGFLRRLKERAPEVVTVMGGANCEGPMGRQMVRSFPFLDLAVSGEADLSFPELCRRVVEEGLPPVAELPETYIHRDSPDLAASRGTLTELDRLPVPDYQEYFEIRKVSPLRRAVYPGIPVETSRGCWWGHKHHCTFCGLNGGGMVYRSKSASRVVSELGRLSRSHNLRRFGVVDNILDMKHVATLLPQLEGKRYSLFYETKANLKRSQLETLQRAGVQWIQPGIESLNDTVLKLMNKGNTAAMNVDLLRNCKDLGIVVEWSVLYAFPGERDEDYAEMARWMPAIFHLQPPLGLARIRYDRFSPYHMHPEAYGVRLKPFWSYSDCYPLNEEEIRELAYFFEDDGPGPEGRCPADKEVELRPGLTSVRRCVERWRSLEVPAVLTAEEVGERLRVVDTRPDFGGEPYTVEGLEAEVFRFCDQPRRRKNLLKAFEGRVGLAQALTRLEELGLVIPIGERWVRLATSPRPQEPPNRFPGGEVVVEQAQEPQTLEWSLRFSQEKMGHQSEDFGGFLENEVPWQHVVNKNNLK